MSTTPDWKTRAVRSGLGCDQEHGAVVAPLHLSSTYTFDGFDRKRQYDYTRSGNPTRDALATALSELEGGAGATITSSGMAAINLVCQILGPDDLLLAPHDCYGGTHRLLTALAARGHCRVEFGDLTDEVGRKKLFALAPRMVLVETPSNPLLRITDLAAIGQLCREHGALFVADNTFLSPAWQRPIEYGADIVLHSTTKYLNGHSDVVGGAVISARAEMAEQIDWWGNCIGVTGAPFDSFLTLRGVRTLHARASVHERNARQIAEVLAAHDRVLRVYYPGLASHPGHAIARRQQDGYGAMISFELDADINGIAAFVEGLHHFFLAESLGGVESLVAHPATMTHSAMTPQARRTAGIGDNLLRLSVGIEDAGDLIDDLSGALQRLQRHERLQAPERSRPARCCTGTG